MKLWHLLTAKWNWVRVKLRRKRPHFRKVLYVSSISEAAKLKPHEIAIVREGSALKWALVPCPCGCGELIHACLMRSRSPHWEFSLEVKDCPTFVPSLWRSAGCQSHFFIRKGEVIWS